MAKKKTDREINRGEATISMNGGPPVDVKDIADAIERRARQKSGKDAAAKAIETLEALRELGPPLYWPTEFKPHLVARKKKAKEEVRAEHGVSFQRDGGDCIVEATNGIAWVRIRLKGEGEHAPSRAIVPAKAMRLLAQAEAEMAALWFHGVKVAIVVDDEIHEFRCIPPELPFPSPELDSRASGRVLTDFQANAEQLHLVQQALAANFLSVRSLKKGAVALLPDGAESGTAGFLATVGP
jgi:hypothetical protein